MQYIIWLKKNYNKVGSQSGDVDDHSNVDWLIDLIPVFCKAC